jgi:hypothetical protein
VDVIRQKVRVVEPDILVVDSGHAITVEQSRAITCHYERFLDRLERKHPSSLPEMLKVKGAARIPEAVGGSETEPTAASFLIEKIEALKEDETPRAEYRAAQVRMG